MAAPLELVQEFLSLWDPHGQYSHSQWQAAQEQAAIFEVEQTSEPERTLRKLGFAVEYKSLSVPGLWVWGRTVTTEKRVYLDREALAFLQESGASLPVPADVDWLPKLILAHELFHILAEQEKVEHSELAAIVFSFNCLWN